jgi:endonuclease/exonuclease/phosphatase family metal-dependent hydrolase
MSDSASHSFRPSWPTAGKGFVRGTLMWHSGDPTQAPRPVTLVSVHLDFSRESVRKAQIAELVTELSDVGTALIIMGDFNADWSVETSPVRVLANGLGLRAFEPTRDGLGTYKRNERLDWILISSELRFIDYAVLPSVVSDHLAVVASIGWEAKHDDE